MKEGQLLAVYCQHGSLVNGLLKQVYNLFPQACKMEVYGEHHRLMRDVQEGKVGYIVEVETFDGRSGLLNIWDHDYCNQGDFNPELEELSFPPFEHLSFSDCVQQLKLINEHLQKETTMTWKESAHDIIFGSARHIVAVDDNEKVLQEYKKFFDACPYALLTCINTTSLSLDECIQYIKKEIGMDDLNSSAVVLLDEQMPNFKGQRVEEQLHKWRSELTIISTTTGRLPQGNYKRHFFQKHSLTANRTAGSALLKLLYT